jgi:hypothetical protein
VDDSLGDTRTGLDDMEDTRTELDHIEDTRTKYAGYTPNLDDLYTLIQARFPFVNSAHDTLSRIKHVFF